LRRPLFLALALLFGLLFAFIIRKEMRDFEVNYRAGERLRAGESLYRTSDGHYMFKYFPLGWDYQFLTSVLALTLLARHWFDFPKFSRAILGANLAVIGLSIYDVIGATAYRTFMSWSVLTVSFLVVVGYLAYLRYRRIN
jgi:hypothetical protein